jgi:hypothetical protein
MIGTSGLAAARRVPARAEDEWEEVGEAMDGMIPFFEFKAPGDTLEGHLCGTRQVRGRDCYVVEDLAGKKWTVPDHTRLTKKLALMATSGAQEGCRGAANMSAMMTSRTKQDVDHRDPTTPTDVQLVVKLETEALVFLEFADGALVILPADDELVEANYGIAFHPDDLTVEAVALLRKILDRCSAGTGAAPPRHASAEFAELSETGGAQAPAPAPAGPDDPSGMADAVPTGGAGPPDHLDVVQKLPDDKAFPARARAIAWLRDRLQNADEVLMTVVLAEAEVGRDHRDDTAPRQTRSRDQEPAGRERAVAVEDAAGSSQDRDITRHRGAAFGGRAGATALG